MRAVIQRVSEASVTVDGEIIGEIGAGLLVLVCAMQGDTEANADKLAQRLAKLRIFSDEAGKMNLSIRDIQGSVLAVSQFTLAGDTSRGNRPGFSEAAPPTEGRHLYEHFLTALTRENLPLATGRFGADMKVRLLNDGPVTLLMEA